MQQRSRARAPDHFATIRRGQKERGVHVTKPIFATRVLIGIRLPYDGLNNASDEVPVLADVHGYDRLDVQHILRAVVRSNVEVGGCSAEER